MKNEIDFSVKPVRVERVFTFPRIYFPGLGKIVLEATPYTPENIANIESRRAESQTLSRLKDKTAKESSFIFSEGFNSNGYAASYENSSLDKEQISEDELELFKEVSTKTLFNEHTCTFSTVLSFFPQKTLFSAGELLAKKANGYKERRSPVDNPESYELTSVIRKKSSVSYQDDSLPALPFSPVSYTPSFINTEANLESSIPRSFTFSREDILTLFRENMKEKDFLKVLPIFELIASGVENSGTMEHVLTFFVSLNEFLEHGENEESFLEFFLKEDNANTVGEYVNTLTFKQYKNTEKIIAAMTAPTRIFNYPVIESSTIRRLISESKKKTLLALENFNLPISDKVILPKDTQVVDRVKDIFDTLEFFDLLEISDSKQRQKILVSDMTKPGNHPNSIMQFEILESFDRYRKAHAEELDKTSEKALTQLISLTDNTFKRYVVYSVLDNYNIKPYQLLVILYALAFPGTINVSTSSKVSAIISYTLRTHAGNVDILTDILITFMTKFDNFKVGASDWREIIDNYNTNLRPQHTIQIFLTSLEGKPLDAYYSKHILENIVKEYKKHRSVF